MANTVQFENTGYAQSKERSKFSHLAMLLIMLPVTILYHVCAIRLFKEKRQRIYIVMSIAITVSFLYLLLVYSFNLYMPGTFIDFSFLKTGENIVGTVFSSIAYLFLGVLWPIGFILVIPITWFRMWQADRFIKQNVAYTLVPTSWCYDWSYARTPFEKMRKTSNIKKIKEGKAWKQGATSLGISVEENKSRDKIVYIKHKDAREHTLISGGTGAGKSFTNLERAKNSIENGFPVCFIDFKRGDDTAVALAAFAKENNARFYHFLDSIPEDYNIPDSEGVTAYDPFANARNSIPEMLVNMREYDTHAEHYKNGVQTFTNAVYKMLRESNRKYFLDEDGEYLIPFNRGEIVKWEKAIENLDVLYWAYTETRREKGLEKDNKMKKRIAEIQKPTHLLNSAMSAVSASLSNLTNSPYADYLDMGNRDKYRNIDLYNSFKPGNNDVVLFSFSADNQKIFSKEFGSLILQDLSNISARRREEGDKNNVDIYIDEFQAVPASTITPLAEKARGSGFALTFISQSLAQVEVSGGKALLNSLISTCSNFIIFNGSNKIAATEIAGVLGERMSPDARISSPARHRTIWESIVEIVEDFDSDNASTTKIMTPILSTEVIQGLQRPNPNAGMPPEMIIINKATPFDNGEHYIKVKAYVSNRVGELVELSDKKEKLPKVKGFEGIDTDEGENNGNNDYIDYDDDYEDNDFNLDFDGEDEVDGNTSNARSASKENSASSEHEEDWELEDLDELKRARKKNKPFDLEEEMKENFAPRKSNGGQRKSLQRNSIPKRRRNDISQKKKNIIDKFD